MLRKLAWALAALVAILGSSGYATVRVAQGQLRHAAQDRAQEAVVIAADLSTYALVTGGWVGAEAVVRRLSQVTGERIRLTSPSAQVIADTDLMLGRRARPTGDPVARIDPRPELTLGDTQRTQAPAVTMLKIRQFREDAARAACFTRAGVGVDVLPGPNGVPRLTAASSTPKVTKVSATAQCPTADLTTANFRADNRAILACPNQDDTPPAEWQACLSRVFRTRTADVTAPSALLFVGTRADTDLTLTPPLVVAVTCDVLALLLTVTVVRRLIRRRGATDHAGAGGDPAATSGTVARMAEAMKRQQEQQRRIVADVAHELRTPLTNMRGYLEGLTAGVIEPHPALFASLHEEALLQQRIIDDLRQQTNHDRHTVSFQSTDVDLAQLVRACGVAHRPASEAAGIRLHLLAGEPVPVTGDPDRLRQVLGNLISNAVRYTPAGGSVEVRTWCDGDHAGVQVRDTGMGIDSQDLPKVFDPYWRADAAQAQVPTGSGLGLSITRDIVAAHGGQIRIDSRPHVGTTVTVLLPRTSAGATPADRPAPDARPTDGGSPPDNGRPRHRSDWTRR